MEWPQLLALLASFVASSFALVRFSMVQHRQMVDRFVSYLEDALRRQEQVNASFEPALQELATVVRENSVLLNRLTGGLR